MKRSTPGRAFTLAVVAALPAYATSASAATLGAAAKGTALAKSASWLALSGAVLGPLLGLLGAWIGTKASLNQTRTVRERQYMKTYVGWLVGLMAVFFVGMGVALFWSGPLWKRNPVALVLGSVFLLGSYVVAIVVLAFRFNHQFAVVRAQEQRLHPEAYPPAPAASGGYEYHSRVCWLGLPLVHIRSGTTPGQKVKPAVGWIALGDRAYGVLLAAGGFAVGGISLGGGSIGLVSLGGLSLGLVSIGGCAIGVWALGGLAIGYMACGGAAIAWYAAQGGLAIAHELAQGGQAIAAHANDAVAFSYFQHRTQLLFSKETMSWVQRLSWACLLLVLWPVWQALRKGKGHGH